MPGAQRRSPRARTRGALAAAGLAALCALASPPVPAAAQVVDFSRVTCAQFNRLAAAQKRQIALWLHGYYTGATQRPFLDMAATETAISGLVETCAQRPETPLLGEEARGVLAGTGPGEPARAVRRSPGHIVIEGAPGQAVEPQPPAEAGPSRPRPLD